MTEYNPRKRPFRDLDSTAGTSSSRSTRSALSTTQPPAKLPKFEYFINTEAIEDLVSMAIRAMKILDSQRSQLSKLPGPIYAEVQEWEDALATLTVRPHQPNRWKERIEKQLPSHDGLRRIRVMAEEILQAVEALNPPLPAPSLFAQTWELYQEGVNMILCCRPTSACGLPLCMMHDVFAQFLADIRDLKPTPESRMLARELCTKMPKAFDSEDDRVRLWEDLTAPFLGSFRRDNAVGSGDLQNRSDGTLYNYATPIAISQLKKEPGSGGDVWFQLARMYDLTANELRDKKSPHIQNGVPMFLLGICGQELQIFGAFFDGKHSLVELLAGPFIMGVSSANTDREYRLALALRALESGFESLTNLTKFHDFDSSLTPRVYTSQSWTFDPPLEAGATVKFKKLLYPTDAFTRFLFSAELSPYSEVLVKLDPNSYGEEVHRLLAQEGLAPKLVGSAIATTIFKAYVMEYLNPQSWQTLHDFLKHPDSQDHMSMIKDKLLDILRCLEDGKMVHGDLRECNIMIQVENATEPKITEGSLNIKVIDFDWAGRAGQVAYPPLLNPDMDWPGKPDAFIEQDDDRRMVRSWFKKQFGYDL